MLKIGVLGSANIAVRSVIPAILELNELFEFVGVASRSEDKANELADKYDTKSYFGYKSILSEVDALYIPLPNSLHFRWVKKALSMGIHVLVEKSIGIDYNEVSQLCKIAEEKKVALVENFQFRCHPQLSEIKEIIKSGEIGAVRYMKSSFEFPPFGDKENIRYSKNLGGGALLDAGAYPIKLTQEIFGLEVDIISSYLRYEQGYEVDLGGGGMLIDKSKGVYSLISFGFDNFYQCSVQVYGSNGMLSTDRVFTSPFHYSPKIALYKNGCDKKLIEIVPSNHFKNMIVHFSNVILNEKLREKELVQNISQSKLIENFKMKANAK